VTDRLAFGIEASILIAADRCRHPGGSFASIAYRMPGMSGLTEGNLPFLARRNDPTLAVTLSWRGECRNLCDTFLAVCGT
jgi:hypothetical protein